MNNQSLIVTRSAALSMPISSAAVVSAFLDGRKGTTLATYRQGLEDFRAFVGADDVDAAASILLSRGHGDANRLALAYRADMVKRKLSAATVNNRLAALRSLVKLAGTLGLVPWRLECENLRSESYRDTKGPGAFTFRRMVEVAGSDDTKSKRDKAAIRLLHDVALRRGEVVRLDLEDLDLAAGTVAVVRKGRTEKTKLSLPAPTLAALRAWVEVRGAEAGPLFLNFDRSRKGDRLTGTSLYRIVRDLGARAGAKVRPHGLRHTGITEACKLAAENGIALEEVLDFSGHANVRTLMVYRDRERNVQGKLAALVAGVE